MRVRKFNKLIGKPVLYGFLGAVALLSIYLTIVSTLSGWTLFIDQFLQFWYFIIALAIGFGIQLGLYIYLKGLVHGSDLSGKVMVISGTTSTGAMISCCAHYLVNILPILGVTGLVSIVSQYQVHLFWVGLIFNIAGIAYISRRVIMFHRS
jgi:Cu+-exporting ATPase